MKKSDIKHTFRLFVIALFAMIVTGFSATSSENSVYSRGEGFGEWWYATQSALTACMMDKLNHDGANKLMIVAHVDDESIWGGKYLLDPNNKFFVLVMTSAGVTRHLTNPSNPDQFPGYYREIEMRSAMAYANKTPFIMLGHPDNNNCNLGRDGFINSTVQDGNAIPAVTEDIRTVLNFKDWDMIVTFSPSGESGHIQHRQTNQIVTELAKEYNKLDKLYYFTHLNAPHAKITVPQDTTQGSLYNRLHHLLDLHVSQNTNPTNWIRGLRRMVMYQQFVPALNESSNHF